MKSRPISTAALAFASLLAAAGGCGGRGTALPSATGGSGGSARIPDAGTGGKTGASDAGVGALDLAADADQDSSKPAADAGAGGFDGAADGSPPDAGDARDGGFATGDGVLCLRPAQALLTDFTYMATDGGTTTAVPFGDNTSFSGTEYVYPIAGAWPLTSDVTGNNWHISGLIGDYSGFGLAFVGCSRLDASAFRGLSFTLSGTVSQGSVIRMGVSTLNNTVAASWIETHGGGASAGPGRCIPLSGTNQYTQSSCVDATFAVPVHALPTVQTILWSDFTGGAPEANVRPTDILAIYWSFPTPAGAGSATPVTYPMDIVIDNLAFVP